MGIGSRRALGSTVSIVVLLACVTAPALAQEEQQQVAVDVESIHVPATTGKLATRGVRVTATCSVNCLLLVEVRLPARVASRLGLTKTQIGEAVGDAQAGSLTTMYAKVKPRVAERLAGYTGTKPLKVDVKAFP